MAAKPAPPGHRPPRPAERSSGNSRASTLSRISQEPSALAASIFASPAGAIRPAASSRATRALLGADQMLPGAAGEIPLQAAPLIQRAHPAVDPAEAQRLFDRILVEGPGQPRGLLGVHSQTPVEAAWYSASQRRHSARLAGSTRAASSYADGLTSPPRPSP